MAVYLTGIDAVSLMDDFVRQMQAMTRKRK